MTEAPTSPGSPSGAIPHEVGRPVVATPAAVVVPAEVLRIAEESIGVYFEPINKIGRRSAAADFLDLSKSFKRARILSRYAGMEGQ